MEMLHIYYSGDVQGVGMRLSAKRIADDLHIAGFVRNLPDGRVELVIQGTSQALSEMKNQLHNKFYEKFTAIDIEKVEPNPELNVFEIK